MKYGDVVYIPDPARDSIIIRNLPGAPSPKEWKFCSLCGGQMQWNFSGLHDFDQTTGKGNRTAYYCCVYRDRMERRSREHDQGPIVPTTEEEYLRYRDSHF